MSIKIIKMQPEHVNAVVSLHCKYLETQMSKIAQPYLLKMRYIAITKSKGSCGFVAEDDGVVAGFICGLWDSKKLLNNIIKQNILSLPFWYLVSLILNLKSRLTRLFTKNELLIGDGLPFYKFPFELRPIVVSEEYRGSGLAIDLIDTLKSYAKTNNFTVIDLITEIDNMRAERFYEKIGFSRKENIIKYGKCFIRYSITL
jgi:GNAT superfamily N-acetyltransferase